MCQKAYQATLGRVLRSTAPHPLSTLLLSWGSLVKTIIGAYVVLRLYWRYNRTIHNLLRSVTVFLGHCCNHSSRLYYYRRLQHPPQQIWQSKHAISWHPSFSQLGPTCIISHTQAWLHTWSCHKYPWFSSLTHCFCLPHSSGWSLSCTLQVWSTITNSTANNKSHFPGHSFYRCWHVYVWPLIRTTHYPTTIRLVWSHRTLPLHSRQSARQLCTTHHKINLHTTI
jgi:hypothetical protein